MLTAGFLLALIPALPPQEGEGNASIQKDAAFALALTRQLGFDNFSEIVLEETLERASSPEDRSAVLLARCEVMATVALRPIDPIEQVEGGTIYFLNAITRARKRFWIATPYFVTDESILSALQMAALRGVDVRVMIPDKPDKWVPWLATFSYLGDMDAAGVKVYRFEPGFLHQKVILVDDFLSSVGTANLDNRSMRLNFEISALVMCREFAKGVESMLEVDFERCRQVRGDDYSSRPIWFRLAVKLSRLASPVL